MRTTLSAGPPTARRVSAERARAQLHSMHCHSCRTFTDSIGSQRVAMVALVPLFAAPHALGMTGGGSVLGGGITGMKAALAGMLAAATVGVSAGGVAVSNPSHAHPVPSHIAAAAGPSSTTDGDARGREPSADAAEPAEAPGTARERWRRGGDRRQDGRRRAVRDHVRTEHPVRIHDRAGRWRQLRLGGHDHNAITGVTLPLIDA